MLLFISWAQMKACTEDKASDGGYWGDIAFSLVSPYRGYAGYHQQWNGLGGRVYTTTDGGITWTATSTNLPADVRIIRIVPDPTTANVVYLVSGKHRFAEGSRTLWKSSDGGGTFSRLGSSIGNIFDVAIDPVTSAIYVTVKNGGVYKAAINTDMWSTLSNSIWGRILLSSPKLTIFNPGSDVVWSSPNSGSRLGTNYPFHPIGTWVGQTFGFTKEPPLDLTQATPRPSTG
eukprot:TRINITY_DN17825_c0_g1_i1.p1 TRINITY_DN17825_c0_g1~~TRINITY_DN17825_c0_g1_i1.p1  ORF type:complete len:231 (+),score=31.11 TRINITY_DN17825_c0_g1_i1:544-1236(+)